MLIRTTAPDRTVDSRPETTDTLFVQGEDGSEIALFSDTVFYGIDSMSFSMTDDMRRYSIFPQIRVSSILRTCRNKR